TYLFKYNDNNKRILASIFISLQVLTHHNTAFVFMFLMIFLFPFFILLRNLSFKEIIKNFVIVGILSLLLTSFWLIPFISELEYSGFIDETKDEIMFKAWSLDIKRVFSLDFTYIYYFGLFFSILGIFGYLISFFKGSFREKIISLGFLFAIILLILLSMGYYGPFPQINLISPLSKVLPYRFLDCLGLLTLIGIYKITEISEKLLEKKKIVLINLFIFSILLVDVFSVYYKIWYPFTSEYHIKEVLPNYIEALKLFSNNFSISYESLYQYNTFYGLESAISYFPIIYNILSINGWYRQGIKNFYRIIGPGSLLEFDSLSDLAFGHLESLLITQNIKCSLIYKASLFYSNVIENLKILGFQKVFENNYYSLWCWNKNSFITPIHYKQIREYKIGRLFAVVGNPLIIKHLDILHFIPADNIHVFKSLDDLADHENIFAYKIIFLYDYGDYKNPEVWRKLEEFVRRGGILVIDTFRTRDMYSTIFNVTSTVLKIEKRNLYSDKYDILRFNEFYEFLEDFDWYATVYRGDIKPIIKYRIKEWVENEYTAYGYVEVEEYAAVGYKNIGYGYVFFIGLNLPYHIDIKDSVYEKFVFNDIIGRFIPIFPDIVDYRILEYEDGKIKAVVDAKFDSWFIVAQTYNPGWRAKLNGVEIPVYEDEDYGLVVLFIPEGSWILELEFVDKWLWLKYVSFSTLILMLVALAYFTLRTRVSSVHVLVRKLKILGEA
ncbi:MAG: hypothetical protein QW067_11990, partial [Thermofilaceae archaeon]